MTDNIAFYNPTEIGTFDLGKSQINKELSFKSEAGVFIPGARVDFYKQTRGAEPGQLFKSYTIGAGLSVAGTNEGGTEKTLGLTLNGADFAEARSGEKFSGECSFFILGDVEITFELEIK